MGVYIKDIEKPKWCIEELDFGLMGNPCKFLETDMSCLLQPESEPFDCGENYETCPLIEIATCGECKWWNKGFCNNGRADANLKLEGNCFCDEGERRANEGVFSRG